MTQDHAGDAAGGKGASDRFFSGFLLIACLALGGLVVVLAMQNRALKARIAEVRAEADQALIQRAPVEGLGPGDAIGALPIVSDGGPGTISLENPDGRRTLLLLFSLDCPACEVAKPFWRRLVAAAHKQGVRVEAVYPSFDEAAAAPPMGLGVAPAGVRDYARTSLVDAPFVPATLLVGADGVIEEAWYGTFDAEREALVMAALRSGSR